MELSGEEGGEIMLEKKKMRGIVNWVRIKMIMKKKWEMVIEWKRREEIMNKVEIMKGKRGKKRIECISSIIEIKDDDEIIRNEKMRIEWIEKIEREKIIGKIEMGKMRCRMKERIGEKRRNKCKVLEKEFIERMINRELKRM